ncbi:hypothetical protein V498_04444 [Pseudogymnoascus sp. VKM F-4517 (FW-2822)]|nr:hypothetical protein V498_04444 [Pseudogymnoascus sp. VKM F-4517 (FW-2822)]
MEEHRDIPQHKMMLRPRNPPPNAKRQRLNATLILTKGEDLKAYDGIRNGFRAAGAVPEIPDREDDPDDVLSVNSSKAAEASHSYHLPSRPPEPMDVDKDIDEDSVIEDGEEDSSFEDEEVSLPEDNDGYIVEDNEEGSLFEYEEVSLSENEEDSLCKNKESPIVREEGSLIKRNRDVSLSENEKDDSFFSAKAVAEHNANELSAPGMKYKRGAKSLERRIFIPVEGMKRHARATEHNPDRVNSTQPEFDPDEALARAPDKASESDSDDSSEYDSDEGLAHATDEEPEYDLDEDLSHFSTAGDDEDKILRLLDEDEDEYQGMLRGAQDDIIEGPDDESLGDASADSSEDLGAIYSELDTYKSFPGALVQVPYVEADVQRFWARFNNIFQGLKEFACGIKYDKTQEKPTYPLSFSFWSILRNIPTEEFMVVYKAAIPQKVQLVLGREVQTPEEILLLDKDWLHHKNGGVYVDLAYTKSRPSSEYGCYIGSTTRAFSKRIIEHLRISRRYVPDKLPDRFSGSPHYQSICRAGTSTNFRVLALFHDSGNPKLTGYIHLLEAIMMIMFQSIDGKRFREVNNSESEKFILDIQVTAAIPKTKWDRLNLAWPATVGFRMVRDPCGNGACVMKVSCRYNSTLCYICSVYKGHNDRLPTRSEIEALMSMKQKQAAIRAMAGPDPRCGDCTRSESMFDENHYTHRTVPGILFCAICWLRIQKIGRRRTPEEATKSLKRIALMTRRKNGETITCENCSVSDNVMTGRRKPHYHYMETDQVLCEPCTKYHRAHGRHRDPNSESNRDFRKGIREKRMRGIKLYCAECDKLEVTDKRKFYCKNSTLLCQTCYRASKDRGVLWKNASTAKWRKGREVVKCENCSVVESLGVGQRPRHTYVTMSRGIPVNKLLCRSCSLYFDRNGTHRDPTAELLRDFKTAIKDKRGKGVPLYCTGCNKVEGGSKRNFTCADVDTLLCGTCYGKRPKKEGAAKKSNT